MKNKVYSVSQKEMLYIREALQKDDSIFIADINGSDIRNLQDYLNAVNTLFKFPIPARGLDGYLDWIRDLDWIKKDGFVLIINDFSKFMVSDLNMKNEIISDLEIVVLPWWETKVEKYVVEGKTKLFMVFLVD